MKSVLIAGGGNFGCWWAASLCLDRNISSITLYDPHVDNSLLALERANLLANEDCSYIFSYSDSLAKLESFYDLVVVSSNSDQRYELFISLHSLVEAPFWVLEKVLTSSLQELDLFGDVPCQSSLFVNHSRRMQPLWRSYKLRASSSIPSLVKQRLGPWDLGSNIFHFVDLISWLYSTSVDNIAISNSSWLQSEKRSLGYLDLVGSIEIRYLNGIVHTIERDIAFKDNLFSFCADHVLPSCDHVYELEGIARLSNKEQISADFLQWSQMAHVFTKNLWNGIFLLPTFSEVHRNTRIVLEALKEDFLADKASLLLPFRIS